MAAKKTTKTKALRGAALVEKIMAHLTGPDSPVGDPQPLDAAGLRAVEEAAGVALSPSLHAVLSFDTSWLTRNFAWFGDDKRLLARPARDLMQSHAGPLAEAYDAIGERRFPGKALPCDGGSDSLRLVYFGDPDEHGEYPVLVIDHDDVPLLAVAWPGVDVWIASQLRLVSAKEYAAETTAAQERILGGKKAWEWSGGGGGTSNLPTPVKGPAPGSVKHANVAVPPKKAGKKLTEKQLEKALVENAERGDLARLRELVADVAARGLPKTWLDGPLIRATSQDHEPAVRLLLDAGASPKAEGSYGCVLAACKTPRIARLLLDAGADANGPYISGQNVLHHAVDNGDVEMVNLLLDAGANPLHEDGNGMTPVHHSAKRGGPIEVLKTLLDRGGRPGAGKNHSRPLHWAIDHGHVEHARTLLAGGADPNAQSTYLERTALHIAFDKGDDAFAGELVRAGADRSIADERGITLEKVYGPSGEDARALHVTFAPSEEPQTLAIELDLAVLDERRTRDTGGEFSASFWADVVSTGLVAGASFDPKKSIAKVLEPLQLETIEGVGPARRSFSIEVAAAGPELLRLLARAFFGRRSLPAFRVVGLSMRGSRTSGGALDAEALRRMLDDASFVPGVFAEPLPFTFQVAAGNPSIAIRAKGKLSAAQEERAQMHVERWFAVLEAHRISGRTALVDLESKNALSHRIVQDAVDDEAKDPFPFSRAAAEALLRNSMRALAAQVPLDEVVLKLPPPAK